MTFQAATFLSLCGVASRQCAGDKETPSSLEKLRSVLNINGMFDLWREAIWNDPNLVPKLPMLFGSWHGTVLSVIC